MKPKILVIEDEDEIRENIARIFELSDYEVSTAINGKYGLVETKKHHPDIIICDIVMPEMDGITFLNFLNNDKEISSIPVIFLTAKPNDPHLKNGLKYGAETIINKPFDIDDLLNAVESRLLKKQQNVKLYENKINILQSNISRSLPHEIRTPMNAILGYSDFLINNHTIIEDADRLDIYNEINVSAKRLQRILDNFLTYASLNNIIHSSDDLHNYRNTKMEFINYSIEDMVKLKIYENDRLDDLVLDLNDGDAYISEIYLSKMLDEIIDNCIKFSKEGQTISAKSFTEDKYYIIEITDNGIGMTEEQLEMLDAYIQFDRHKNEQQGAGLGLAIVKKIVDLFDGKIYIRSQKNKFTTIRIFLRS